MGTVNSKKRSKTKGKPSKSETPTDSPDNNNSTSSKKPQRETNGKSNSNDGKSKPTKSNPGSKSKKRSPQVAFFVLSPQERKTLFSNFQYFYVRSFKKCNLVLKSEGRFWTWSKWQTRIWYFSEREWENTNRYYWRRGRNRQRTGQSI